VGTIEVAIVVSDQIHLAIAVHIRRDNGVNVYAHSQRGGKREGNLGIHMEKETAKNDQRDNCLHNCCLHNFISSIIGSISVCNPAPFFLINQLQPAGKDRKTLTIFCQMLAQLFTGV
jgi:hypothetical protein